MANVETATWTVAEDIPQYTTLAVTQEDLGGSFVVALVANADIAGGVLTFQVQGPDGNWYDVLMTSPATGSSADTLTLGDATTSLLETPSGPFTNFRVNLTTVLSGSGGSVAITVAAVPGS